MTKTTLTRNKFSVVMAATLASVLSFSSPSLARPQSSANTAVTIQEVNTHEISQSLSLVGKLKAKQAVIISPEVSGTIERIAVSANQDVKTGQLLIQLSDDKAKAAVAEAQAYLNDEKRKLNEFERLRASAAVTLTEIEDRKPVFKSLRRASVRQKLSLAIVTCVRHLTAVSALSTLA